MPQAPDLDTLYDLATPIEQAFQSLLGGLTPPIAAFTQRQTSAKDSAGNPIDLPAERIDIQFTKGAWNGRWGITKNQDPIHPEQNLLAHSGWSYTLRFEVRTNRVPQDEGVHARMVAAIGALILRAAAGGYFLGLACHSLTSIDEQNAAPQVSVEDDLDLSVLTYRGEVVIRSDAWPDPGP